jgi:hypothetical protein
MNTRTRPDQTAALLAVFAAALLVVTLVAVEVAV